MSLLYTEFSVAEVDLLRCQIRKLIKPSTEEERWSVHHLNCFLAVTLYIHMDVFNQKLILLYPKLTRLFEVTTYFFCLYVDNIFCLRVLLPQWGS